MAVTVKTVKKKPLSLKKPGGPAAPVEPELDAEGNPIEAPAPVAAPVAPAEPAKPIKKASYTFAGICAILTFLMFVAILTLQILEWKFYLAPPKSAFPPFGTLLPIPGGSSVSSVPVAEADEFTDDVAPAADEGTGEADPEPVDESIPAE